MVEDTELGQVIQLQGDQRKNVSGFLIANKLAKKVVPAFFPPHSVMRPCRPMTMATAGKILL